MNNEKRKITCILDSIDIANDHRLIKNFFWNFGYFLINILNFIFQTKKKSIRREDVVINCDSVVFILSLECK